MGQHRPAKTVFLTVPSNSDWQWTVELRAGWPAVPLSTLSWSCKEQLKIDLCWSVVWRLTFSGVGRMITCRRLNILCRINTKGEWQIQQTMLIWQQSCARKEVLCKMTLNLCTISQIKMLYPYLHLQMNQKLHLYTSYYRLKILHHTPYIFNACCTFITAHWNTPNLPWWHSRFT